MFEQNRYELKRHVSDMLVHTYMRMMCVCACLSMFVKAVHIYENGLAVKIHML